MPSASGSRRTSACPPCRRSPATTAATCWSPARSAPTTGSCCRSTSCRSSPASATPRSCSTRRASCSRARASACRFNSTDGDAGVDVILLTPYPRSSISGCRRRAGKSSSLGAQCPSRACASSYPMASATTGWRCRCELDGRSIRPRRHLARAAHDRRPRLEAATARGARPRGSRHRAAGVFATPTGRRRRRAAVRCQRRRAVADALSPASDAAARLMARRARVAGVDASASAGRRALPYSVIVHTYSNLSLQRERRAVQFRTGRRGCSVTRPCRSPASRLTGRASRSGPR